MNHLLSVHLIQNVVLAEWAPLLVVLGIPPALAARAPRVPPLPALLLWVVNYGVWHLPWIYDAALRQPALAAAPRARALLRHRRPALVADRARHDRARPESRLPLRRVPAREPDRARDGARARADLRLLRRRSQGSGACPRSATSRSPASRWRSRRRSSSSRRSRSSSRASSPSRTRRLEDERHEHEPSPPWLLQAARRQATSRSEADRRATSDRRSGAERRASRAAAGRGPPVRQRPPLGSRPPRRARLDRTVGAAGFEPAASRSQSECATRLRYAPLSEASYA